MTSYSDKTPSNQISLFGLSTQEYHICYFDILGYKNNIQNVGEIGYLSIIYDAIETFIKHVKELFITKLSIIKLIDASLYENLDFGYRIFSDNFIVFVRKTTRYIDKIILRCLIYGLYDLQRALIENYHMLVRGALTEGSLYINGEFIYGNGLIRAYTMENEVAKFPRIIIDDACIDNLNVETHSYSKSETIITSDTEGIHFIGYLNPHDEPDKNFIRFLYIHRHLISTGLKDSSEKTRPKYMWCSNYHNAICKQFRLKIIVK